MPTRDTVAKLVPAILGVTIMLAVSLVLVGALNYPLISPIKDFPGTVTGRYFDMQGLAMTIGRLDVPCDSLQWEAIQIGDRCYGYFGLTPSLFRIMLNGLCLPCFGQWSRLMMVAGGLVYFLACLRLADRALPEIRGRAFWTTGFALAMSLGSSLVFILSDPYGYHEAILWANACGLLAFWAIGRYVDGGQRKMLRLALFLILLALHARFTVGVGVAAGAMIWLVYPHLARRAALKSVVVPVLIIGLFAATPIGVNFLKFGAVMPPAQKQKFYANFPERLEKIKNGAFQTDNFACDASLYFSPDMIRFTAEFPYLAPAYDEYWFAGKPLPAVLASRCGSANIEALDPMYSMTAAMPGPLLLFLAGLAVMARRRAVAGRWLPPLAGAAAACLPLLLLTSVTYRYTLDFMPLLVLGGLPAWREIALLPSRWMRSAAILLVVALSGWGLAVNLGASLSSGSPQPYMFVLERDVQHMLGLTR